MSARDTHPGFVKVYHGYGHKHDMLLYGHLFREKIVSRKLYSTNIILNFIYLVRLFFVTPLAHAGVSLRWRNQCLDQKTETDGFIKFEWRSETPVAAGWHSVAVTHTANGVTSTGNGELFVPHITQYGFISDIDDTVMISHSAKLLRRLRTLFTRNPHTRRIFEDVDLHYRLLAESTDDENVRNPFFYVSSSEWNLYNYLVDFFDHHQLPRGAFLLNHIKRWPELFLSGNTGHDGKLIRVARILQAFPNQQFILLGDNTQRDPLIYKAIAEKYPGRIFAVYIRNAHAANASATRELLDQLQREKGVHALQFNHSSEAIDHSKAIGLIH